MPRPWESLKEEGNGAMDLSPLMNLLEGPRPVWGAGQEEGVP